MNTKNMNYMFHVEYFEDVLLENTKTDENLIKEHNDDIMKFQFQDIEAPYAQWKHIPGYQEIVAYTLYPGLLIGSGNPHEIAVKGAAKLGFSFDYVTGLPYIPGSSLKGMLRAYFPGDTSDQEKNKELENFISGLLSVIASDKTVNIHNLKKDMFEGGDIFLGAFPEPGKAMLEMDYITPHKEFKNPNPISFLKVKPGVKFVFSVAFSDYEEDGTVVLTKEQKRKLCEEILLLMGIGAKTNIGYGRFSKEVPKESVRVTK